jgi:septal ring factor EnvC (AmiA/AmiB activator)
MDAVHETDTDTLDSLEERINRAVQAITQLRGENQKLQDRLKATEEELAATRNELNESHARSAEFQKENGVLEQKLQQTSDELSGLRGERKQVKARIEKLLGQLDLLSAS